MTEPHNLRNYLKALPDAQAPDADGPDASGETMRDHPDEETLMALAKRELSDGLTGKIRQHMIQCGICSEKFEDISDFFGAAELEDPVSEFEVERQWKAFWSQATEAAPPRRASSSSVSWSTLAAAAALVLATGLSAGWGLLVSRENRALDARLAEGARRTEEQIARLESENEGLRSSNQNMESRIAELNAPQAVVPMYDVFSFDMRQRAGGAIGATRVSVPASAGSFVLILNGGGQPVASAYTIELLDNNDASLWRSDQVVRNRDGNFVLTFPRAFATSGAYRLRLYRGSGERLTRLADYEITIATE